MNYVVEFSGNEWSGIGGFFAESINDAIDLAVQYVRNQASGEKGETVEWFIYQDTGNPEKDSEVKLAEGNLIL